jgi:hypothetical protein
MRLVKALLPSTTILVTVATAAVAFAYVERGPRPAVTAPASFSISGRFGRLWPGTAQPIDLVLRNHGSRPIAITGLRVWLVSVRASRATTLLRCPTSEFKVSQYAGRLPLFVGPRKSFNLRRLRVAWTRWPRLSMLELGVDQDGCQGASVALQYSGAATVR